MRKIKSYIYKQIKEGTLQQEEAGQLLEEISGYGKYADSDIAIVGMACRLPNGIETIDEFENALRFGMNCITDFPEQRKKDLNIIWNEASEYIHAKGGYLKDIACFDPAFFRISPREAYYMDPAQRLFLEVAWEALEDAGEIRRIQHTNTGIYIGEDTSAVRYVDTFTKSDPFLVTGSNVSLTAGRLANILDLQGGCYIIDTACSSSLVALNNAVQHLRLGVCDQAIVGGVALTLSPEINTQLDASDGRVKAFDEDADGTVWGEGVCAILIMPLEKAIAQRNHIYAVIKGGAVNGDGQSNGLTAPNAEAQSKVIQRAWKNAGVNSEVISYIETHGTGTKLGDPIELYGLSTAFGASENTQFCGIGSLKTNLGHIKGASGIASVIKVALSMKNRVLYPSLNFNFPNQLYSFARLPFYVNDCLHSWEPDIERRVAGISSFGFSGTNCHIIMEEYQEEREVKEDSKPEIFLLSAHNKSALVRYARKMLHFVANTNNIKGVSLQDICYTSQVGRIHYQYRLAIICISIKGLTESLMEFIEAEEHYLCNDKTILWQKSGLKYQEEYNKLAEQLLHKDTMCSNCSEYKKECSLVRLPTYPFENERIWPMSKEVRQQTSLAGDTDAGGIYHIEWKKKRIQENGDGETNELPVFLMVYTDHNKKNLPLEFIPHQYYSRIIAGELLRSNGLLNIKESEQFHYFKHIYTESRSENGFHLIYYVDVHTNEQREEFYDIMTGAVSVLLELTKMMSECFCGRQILLTVLAQNVHAVMESDISVNNTGAVVFGLTRSIRMEYSFISCSNIDFDQASVELLYNYIGKASQQLVVLRSGEAYYACISPYSRKNISHGDFQLRKQGVYVITGGLGGIGQCIASYLLKMDKSVRIVLLGRSILDDNTAGTQLLQKLKTGNEDRICYIRADISDEADVAEAFKKVRKKYGSINGIFHCAGIPGAGLVMNLKIPDLMRTAAPKVKGTLLLEKYTEKDFIDFIVLFSSIASVLGGIGQADYIIANAFMDAYAMEAQLKKRKVIAVNWAPWIGIGMMEESGEHDDIIGITKEKGLEKLFRIIAEGNTGLIVGEIKKDLIEERDLQRLDYVVESFREDNVTVMDHTELKDENYQVNLTGRSSGIYTDMEKIVACIWSKVMFVNTIDVNQEFIEMGGDSRLAIELFEELQKELPYDKIDISVTDIFTYSSVASFSSYVDSMLHKINKPDDDKVLTRDSVDITFILDKIKSDDMSIDKGLELLK